MNITMPSGFLLKGLDLGRTPGEKLRTTLNGRLPMYTGECSAKNVGLRSFHGALAISTVALAAVELIACAVAALVALCFTSLSEKPMKAVKEAAVTSSDNLWLAMKYFQTAKELEGVEAL